MGLVKFVILLTVFKKLCYNEIMKKYFSKIMLYKLALIVLIIVLDILSKILFNNLFLHRTQPIVIIEGLLELIFVKNTGASFGIFAGETFTLAIVSAIFVVLIFAYDIIAKEKNIWYTAAFICLVGGAIGNFLDRLFLGYVRDFIGFANWFVCNIADVFVFLGVVFYLVFVIIDAKKVKKETHACK